MSKHFTNIRHWAYKDDFTLAPNKQTAIAIFERFYKKAIRPSEVKEIYLKDYVKENAPQKSKS